MEKNWNSFRHIIWARCYWWLFPHHLCGSLLLLRCLHRGVWVLTAIYWISLKPLPPTTITGHLWGGARMSCVPPQKGPSVTGREGGESKGTLLSCLFLQRVVESEREFWNSLFLTNRSTFVLHGIPLSESLLVASSILYSFFSLLRAHFIRARMWLTSVATVTTEVMMLNKLHHMDSTFDSCLHLPTDLVCSKDLLDL